MTAPTQALPAWLSYTTITLPQTTETSVVYLPLTYYGPSIPLNSDWTYGGLSSPVTSATPTTSTTAIPPSTTATTATPSSSNATPSSTSPASSPTSSSPSSLTSPTSSLSPSASPSSSSASPSASASHGLTRAQLIGIVVASVLGSLVLFLLVLCCWSRFCGRRWRNGSGREGREGEVCILLRSRFRPSRLRLRPFARLYFTFLALVLCVWRHATAFRGRAFSSLEDEDEDDVHAARSAAGCGVWKPRCAAKCEAGTLTLTLACPSVFSHPPAFSHRPRMCLCR
ncbi:hypothetical protein C8R47DRAFT_431694 [Mycena vitilis]|nr:hypothetical protein C8R47DRAFT_431694 [Mycena vitilis]